QSPSYWKLQNILCDVAKDIANAAAASDITAVTVNVQAKVTEAVNEYATRLIPLIVTQITDYVDEDTDNNFYLKSFSNDLLDPNGNLRAGLPYAKSARIARNAISALAQEAQGVSTALQSLIEARKRTLEVRESEVTNGLKSGQVISKTNHERMGEMQAGVKDVIGKLQSVHDGLGEMRDLHKPKGEAPQKSVLDPALKAVLADFE